VGDQPRISVLSVKRSLVTVDLNKSIYRFGANPEGGDRAASCRPPFGLGPWIGARVVSPRSPILRPGQESG
jgi:hypothetical protein